VTEPIEFAFMFIAPVLYAVHAVLTGLALAVMDALNIRLGFTFSGGAIDYVLSFGKSTNGLLMLPIGVAYFIVYYFVFTAAIRFWKLATPGREAAEVITVATADRSSAGDRARAFIDALGGAENLISVDACTTRLRLAVAKNAAINEPALRALGAKGIVKPAAGSVQVVLGPEADLVADTIRAALAQWSKAGSPASEVSYDRTAWLAGLGGSGNLRAIEAIAATRLRTELVDTGRIDEDALKQLGAVGVMKFSTTLAHIILKTEASDLATVLQGTTAAA
jgi:PTS system N-acetylglucosamine-specific IIC component